MHSALKNFGAALTSKHFINIFVQSGALWYLYRAGYVYFVYAMILLNVVGYGGEFISRVRR